MALPEKFKPCARSNLIRVGKENDGGYLVEKSSISETDYLISLGVGADWSFESDFRLLKKVPVVAYDHTVGISYFRKLFLRSTIKALLFRCSWGEVLRVYRLCSDYRAFFSTQGVSHVQKKVGFPKNDCSDIAMIIENISRDKNIFFKIDIEGSEYRILDELVLLQDRISGLVIEFHDCDLHRSRIVRFINNIALPLVHIHANNFAGYDACDDPLVMEMTFASKMLPLSGEWKGSELDQPNNPRLDELVLHFSEG